jgi:hypothetical protein
MAVNDWLVAGVWAKPSVAPTASQLFPPLIFGANESEVRFNNGGSNNVQGGFPVRGDGEWVWSYNYGKVTTPPTSGTADMSIGLRVASTEAIDFYAPVLVHIPAGTMSDTEVLEFAQHLQTWSDGAPVGHVTTLRGQKLITHGGLGVGNSAAVTGSLPTPTRKMEVFDAAGVSLGYVPIYPSIT